jgi:hypothetical protein
MIWSSNHVVLKSSVNENFEWARNERFDHVIIALVQCVVTPRKIVVIEMK